MKILIISLSFLLASLSGFSKVAQDSLHKQKWSFNIDYMLNNAYQYPLYNPELSISFVNFFLQLSTNIDFDEAKVEYVLLNPIGKEIVGSANKSFISIPEGQYTLLYSFQGCDNKKTSIITNERNCSNKSNQETFTNKPNLIIYPNPCKENFSIFNDSSSVVGFHYKISSINGQVLVDSYTLSNTVDIKLLSSGMYILTIEFNNFIYYSKIIKT